jgi:hypothetical protein
MVPAWNFLEIIRKKRTKEVEVHSKIIGAQCS